MRRVGYLFWLIFGGLLLLLALLLFHRLHCFYVAIEVFDFLELSIFVIVVWDILFDR